MQSGFSDKIAFNYTPCKEPEPCYDYDDYDPCESSDDITEKDLAVLLKEEKLKLQKEKERAAAAAATDAGEVVAAAFVKPTAEEKALADAVTTLSAAQGEKARLQTKPTSEPDDKAANKPSNEEVEEKPSKKRICKKFIKNPFFTNRFKFSSDFPPPPPGPPPQNLPLVEEDPPKDKLSCLRRKKKCDKKVKEVKNSKGGVEVNVEVGVEVDVEVGVEVEEEKIMKPSEIISTASENIEEVFKEKSSVAVLKVEETTKEKIKRCVKKWEKPSCRKKDVEIPVTLQPRQIPAAQKDLPDTSPMLLPEVQRQFKMSCKNDCRPASPKKKCKDKTK